MAQIPNLDNALLNLSSLREQSQKELLGILKSGRGRKCIVMDPNLSSTISQLIPTSLLKETDVELRILSNDYVKTDCLRLIYIVRSQIDLMKLICSSIASDVAKGLQRAYSIYFVPRRTVVCEKILEEEKLHQLVDIGEFPLYVVPLDEDVLSFDLNLSYKECVVDGDRSSLWHVAKAIHKLEFSFGLVPNVKGLGKSALKVVDILKHMQVEEPVDITHAGVPEINMIVLLDREVDMFTPMCLPLTYEGIMDEILRINNGSIELDASIMGSQQDGKKMRIPLNSSDKLFKEIRDLQFGVVMQMLRERAMSMKQDYAEISSTRTVSELKDFVKKLNSLPEISRHVNLAQHLFTFTSKPSFTARLDIEQTILEGEGYDICFEYIEEMIHKQEPLVSVIRLLVLFSITNGGLPKKNFDYLRRELLQSYGYEHMFTLKNLEKAGLLKKQEAKGSWQSINRALKLLVDDRDPVNPSDISYIYSGYAPLSIRLVQHALRSGWQSIEEILKLLPAPHVELKRGVSSNFSSLDPVAGLERSTDGHRSLVLVVFIGGVTLGEISALRFLSSQEGTGYDFIVASTKIINGDTLLETLISNGVQN